MKPSNGKLDAICNGLPLVIGIADDMIIWIEKDDYSDCDASLYQITQWTRENNLKLSLDKIQNKKERVKFIRMIYTMMIK